MAQAACRGKPVEWWFIEGPDARARNHRPVPAQGMEAKAICGTCPVRNECLAYAIKNGELFGVWGGYAPKKRRGMRLIR